MLPKEDKEFIELVKPILDNKDFKKLRNIKHHGISRYDHLMKVAYRSYIIAKKRGLDYKSTAIGALIHDFYLEGNERSNMNRFLDTFRHPKKVIEVCANNFDLNEIEKNIILSHMFPIYPVFPKYKESRIVNWSDKIISAKEMFNCLWKKTS